MSKFTFEDIVLSFAGIHQAAMLVQEVATTGNCNEAAFNVTIGSLFHLDSPDVPSIYGGKEGLRLGLTSLTATLTSQARTVFDKQIARLVLSMIQVERHLQRNPDLLVVLKRKIEYAKNQADFFTETHSTVINTLAKIYEDTIGKLSFKIGIIGKRELLSNPEAMSKIRAILLAGIRSAVLWQQVGGNRWQLIFGRRQYKAVLAKG
ncbi:MAG: high frequency lysogenization protein HflD [Legionellales bacterium]|nr:high frequency lysogenization protein HflD [Legionellales bacterium]